MEKKPILQKILDRCDLGEEDLPGRPLVEIMGDGRILVENHQGITEYGSDQICIRVCYGAICVSGSNLRLRHAACKKLLIIGRIDAVRIIRGRSG